MENDFLSVILELRSGQLATSLNEKFNALVAGVLETGRKGEIILKLIVKPKKMSPGGGVIEVEIEHDAKNKIPELPIGAGTFFVDPKSGRLMREDPAQTALFEASNQKEVKKHG